MRRVRQIGMFQGLQLDDAEQLELPELDPNARWLYEHGFSDRRMYPDTPVSTYDPLSDPLNDPFPEEQR